MESLKKGDAVEINAGFTYHFRRGDKFTIDSVSEKTALLNVKINFDKGNFKKIGESKMQYEQSNRYKLAQAIKKTGISAKALSRAVAGNECYFYNKTGVARFNKRGDIPDDVLNLALTELAFAEREVLGIGADTVEDTPVEATQHMEFANGEVHYFKINESIEEKPKSNKPLFIGAAVVISIVLILFVLNNSQVV